MKRNKKIVSLMLSVAILGMTMASSIPVHANISYAESEPSEIICWESGDSLEDFDENTLNSTSAIVFDEDGFQSVSSSELVEILDNGTSVFIRPESFCVAEEKLPLSAEEDESKNVVGYMISSNGADYDVSTIEYAFAEDDSVEEENIEKCFNEILENEPIDYEQVLLDAEKLESVDRLNELETEQLVMLQTSADVGSSFMDNDKFVYLYKEGKVNDSSTDYMYSSATSKDGYSKIGSLSLLIYAIKIKTFSETTYDSIYATCTASGLNDKWVTKFNVSISVTESDNNSIIDYTSPEGGDSSVTATIGTSVNSKGEVESSSEISYEYNPDSLASISPECGEKYVKTWKCIARTGTAYKNKSWTVKPAIVLKKVNGKSTPVTTSVYVDYFQVAGSIRKYTMTSVVKTSITFKNHIAVF